MTPSSHCDRSAGLVFFGVIEILIGVFTALLVPLMVAAIVVSRSVDPSTPSLDLKTTLPSMVIYAVVAVLFIWIGIGSIRARRWARALMLSVSWLWLITGIISMVALWLVMLGRREVAMPTGLPEATLILVIFSVAGFLGLIYGLLPLAFVLFYRSESVVATCRERDPNPSWFDSTPPQIVSLVVVYALGLVSVLVMPAYNFIFPLFGIIVDGWVGGLAWLAVAALLVYLLAATIRFDPRAWGVAMAASVVGALSSIVTAAVVPYSSWVNHMGLPLAQEEIVAALGEVSTTTMVLMWVLMWASWIGYLFHIRRFVGQRQR